MRSVRRFLGWFLFAPYFAVEGLHLRPFFTDDQAFGDRVRAQAAVALILALLGDSAFAAFGVDMAAWVGVVFYFGVYALLHLIMNRERERRLRAAYRSMPKWKRYAFASSTVALVLLSTIVPLQSGQLRAARPPWARVHCVDKGSEITAESCRENPGR